MSPNLTATTGKPATAPKPSSGAGAVGNNVALAPQLVAAQMGALAAALAGSTASAQALAFYRIPLFMLPIYQAAAAQYGVPWQILAAINEIETNYGNNLAVSSAGAVGWMQFMPATWIQYGVDALNAGYADPYNPVDAVFAAARYLRAAGAASDLRAAILAYNHSAEYVSSVLLRAKLISTYPQAVIATLTGLTDARLPVSGKRIAWGALSPAGSTSSATANATAVPSQAARSSAQPPVAAAQGAGALAQPAGVSLPPVTPRTPAALSPTPAPTRSAGALAAPLTPAAPPLQLLDVMSAPNAAVVAVQDGRVVKLGHSPQLGKYVILRDVYGDVFTYAGLGSIATSNHPPAPAPSAPSPDAKAPATPAGNAQGAPKPPASATSDVPVTLNVRVPVRTGAPRPTVKPAQAPRPRPRAAFTATGKVRLFAHPGNPDAIASAARAARRVASHALAPNRPPALRGGSIVAKGTVLGHVRTPAGARDGHLRFAIRPAGDQSSVDPRPILQNWAQLQAALHPQGARSESALLGATASGVFLLSQAELQREVLSDPGIAIFGCARQDIASGAIDKRVLAVLAFLSRSGLKPTVGALGCARGADGAYASERQAGAAVEISAINAIPIAAHQGAGSITDTTIATLLSLHGEFRPREIVSLMHYPMAANTLARADHWGKIHIGFAPDPRARGLGSFAPGAAHWARAGLGAPSPLLVAGALSGTQWDRLMARIAALPVPSVARKPSPSAIRDTKGP